MIWHIFKKDWRLLWPMVIGVVLANLLQYLFVADTTNPFGHVRASTKAAISSSFESIVLLAVACLIVMVVQEDAIPGLRQDWLVRPIRRRDLLLSKIIFVAVLVQAPIFLAEFAQALVAGFSVNQSLSPALSRSLWMLLEMDLPLIAFATLTRNLTEAIGAGLMIVLTMELFISTTIQWTAEAIGHARPSWVILSGRIFWIFAAGVLILALQYNWRKTVRARWACGSALAVGLIAQLIPWQAAFAVESRFSPLPGAANAIQITFEPKGFENDNYRGDSRIPHRPGFPAAAPDVVLWLPLHLTGLSDNEMLIAEHITAWITGPDRKVIDLGDELEPRGNRWNGYKPLWVPEEIYNRLKDQPVHLGVDYALALMKAAHAYSLPAAGGEFSAPDVGRCATRINSGDTAVELRCLVPGKIPCVTWSLIPTGKHFAQNSECGTFYPPYAGSPPASTMSRFGDDFPFRDPNVPGSGVDESQLKRWQVTIEAYRPEAQFTRHVAIPDIRLSDWKRQ